MCDIIDAVELHDLRQVHHNMLRMHTKEKKEKKKKKETKEKE